MFQLGVGNIYCLWQYRKHCFNDIHADIIEYATQKNNFGKLVTYKSPK